jgi:small subunit ribosomal protein S11
MNKPVKKDKKRVFSKDSQKGKGFQKGFQRGPQNNGNRKNFQKGFGGQKKFFKGSKFSSPFKPFRRFRNFIDWQASSLGQKVTLWIAYQRMNFEKSTVPRFFRLESKLKSLLSRRFLPYRSRIILKGVLKEVERNRKQLVKFQVKYDRKHGRRRRVIREREQVSKFFRVFVRETLNNIFAVVLTPKGKMLFNVSLGMGTLKGAKRRTPYAAEVAGRRLALRLRQRRIYTVDAILRSAFSPMIRAVFKGMAVAGVKVFSVANEAMIAHNGTRPKKARRI